MIKNFRFIFILLSVSVNIYAQDSIPVIDKLQTNLSPLTHFSSVDKYNPASMSYTLQKGLSDINITYEKQTGDVGLVQKGTAFDKYAFNAESYANNGKHHLWGNASYTNSSTDKIKWNESSDYENIYPYVFADSLGGDNLKGEKYSFMGGYAQNLQKISWGIQFSYWALMEYRKIDPRPDNNTSNLIFNAGINYKLTKEYALGGGLMLRKYKQKNKLKFYSELGKPYVYHMTGLGSDAYLFANDITDCLYDGNGYGANVQLLPLSGKGLSATLVYENFAFERQQNNTQNLSLSEIDEDKFIADISYLKQKDKHTIGIKLEAVHVNRKGTEGKFTREGSTLVKISSQQQYENELIDANLTFIYQQNKTSLSWYAMPYLSFSNRKENHKSSDRNMKIDNMGFGLKPGISKFMKRHLLHIDANLGYAKNLNSDLALTGLTSEKSLTQALQANYNFLSSDILLVDLSARFDYALPKTNASIYLKSTWSYRKYDMANSNLLEFRLGMVF